jgi:transposase
MKVDALQASLKSRLRDDRDARITQLQAKLGEVTMDNELLQEKIDRMEAGRPFVRWRSRR